MDDFTPYGDSFEDSLENLENLVKQCKPTHVSLSTVKCHMMMEEGITIGHFISVEGIWVYPTKVEVILNFPTLETPTMVHRFIFYVGYYQRFIEFFSKIAFPLFQLLSKDA